MKDQTNQLITIRVIDIVIDPTIQPRVGGIDNNHVRTLEEAIDDLLPLSVVVLNGGYVLVDGWHRLAALQNRGRAEVSALVLDVPDDDDLQRLAFDLNASHGRPLSLDDRRAEAARVLEANPTISDREVGRHCGLSQPTVAKIRTELEQSARIERTTERVGRGGYRYEVDSAKDADETTRRAKNFERFFRYVGEAVQSDWWDESSFVQLLLDSCDEEHRGDTLEALREVANPLVSLADLFESSI